MSSSAFVLVDVDDGRLSAKLKILCWNQKNIVCGKSTGSVSRCNMLLMSVCKQSTVGQQGDRVAWTTLVAIGHTQLNPEVWHIVTSINTLQHCQCCKSGPVSESIAYGRPYHHQWRWLRSEFGLARPVTGQISVLAMRPPSLPGVPSWTSLVMS